MADQVSFAVALTIPDNAAFTARAALRRIGIAVGDVRRADIWTFDMTAGTAVSLGETIATVEVIFNPNKHELRERPSSRPLPGEVWIVPIEEIPSRAVGGRHLPGVEGIRRRVAWQLLDDAGQVVDATLLDRAIETFLCNPAFQKAIR
jgi:hypothetical protein